MLQKAKVSNSLELHELHDRFVINDLQLRKNSFVRNSLMQASQLSVGISSEYFEFKEFVNLHESEEILNFHGPIGPNPLVQNKMHEPNVQTACDRIDDFC